MYISLNFFHQFKIHIYALTWQGLQGEDPKGGGVQGVRTPLKNQKKYIVFLSITGPVSPKNPKLPSKHLMLDHHRHASEIPFKWRFACGPMMACYNGI